MIMASGCSQLRPKNPTVAVQGVSVSSVSFTGISGTLSVKVTNPNHFGVPLASVDWQLTVGGARAVSGTIELSNTIPANGSTNVDISLTVRTLDAVRVARKLAAGARTYRISGVLHFNAPIGRIDVAFSGEGDLGQAISATTGQDRLAATVRGLAR